MRHFIELGHPIFDRSVIQSISDPALRMAVGRFNQRFMKPAVTITSLRLPYATENFEAKSGGLVPIMYEARRLGVIEAVICEYEFASRNARRVLSLDTWRLNALYSLIWVAKRDLTNIRQLTDKTTDLQARWGLLVEQTRLALGESRIARYINDPDPNKSNIDPENPILITRETLTFLRSPSLEQLTIPEPSPGPVIQPRNQLMATRPEVVRPQIPAPSPTPEVTSKPFPSTTPSRRPQIEYRFDKQTLEVLKGWDVERVRELLNLILPNNDSVTGTQLPPEVEGLTRMVVNMAQIKKGLPLVAHEDLLTNNEARLALGIMGANLTQHPEIKHLANLYRLYRMKIAKDQQQA